MGTLCVHTCTLRQRPYHCSPARILTVPLWHRPKASIDGDRGMLLPQPSPIPGAERWSPVLDRFCLTPCKQHSEQAAAPAHASAGRPCLLQAQQRPQGLVSCSPTPVPPCHPPLGFAVPPEKGPSVPQLLPRRLCRMELRTSAATVQAEGTAVTRAQEQTLMTALGSGCSDRTPAASPDLQVCKDVLRINSLQDESICGCISLPSLLHLLFPSTNQFLRFNSHQYTAISSSPCGEESLQ